MNGHSTYNNDLNEFVSNGNHNENDEFNENDYGVTQQNHIEGESELENNNLEEDYESIRFAIELEFVLCLANPWYLSYLAQQPYYDTPQFINYLSYLKYWASQNYVLYIQYPLALYFLELLQDSGFRESLKDTNNVMLIHEKQYYHWLYCMRPLYQMEVIDQEEEENLVDKVWNSDALELNNGLNGNGEIDILGD